MSGINHNIYVYQCCRILILVYKCNINMIKKVGFSSSFNTIIYIYLNGGFIPLILEDIYPKEKVVSQ